MYIVLNISSHEKLKGVSLFKKFICMITFPLFMALQFPIDYVALFSKKVTWAPIPHQGDAEEDEEEEEEDEEEEQEENKDETK